MSEAANGSDLSDDRERSLAALLDEVIPPSKDGKLPGAGHLGIARSVFEGLKQNPDLQTLVMRGLEGLDALARGRGATSFAALSDVQRREALNELTRTEVTLMPSLAFATCTAYYQQPEVLEGLGREGRPPHPKGYEMEPFDFTLLDPVRQRAKMYRE